MYFTPYFRRTSQLHTNIDAFMVELRNLARIMPYPEQLALLQWCLSLYRRVLRADRMNAYEVMHGLFGNLSTSDARWMNLFQTSNPLDDDAAPHDITFQIFETIDGVAEGCFRPQLQLIYAFAVKDATGIWPDQVLNKDFGSLVATFPSPHRDQVPILLGDADLKININQWRNIAAHKSYRLVAPKTIEISFGKQKIQTRRLGLHRLRRVSRWIQSTHHAVRLANTIILIEHIKEIAALGLPDIDRPLSASLLRISHDLSTVGFEVVDWKESKQIGTLVVRDRLARDPTQALIHASQQMVNLSIGVLTDVSMCSRITKVCVQLQLPNGHIYGSGIVAVSVADAFSCHKINLRQYSDQIEWRHGL
ncbi:hypothetical protein [Paraburkholderia nemoris]|uniref:hypothetical protein n=1 Tax=Paraburkholderia nemoris TaxID=2793076 RepID=UPI001B8D7222|nr:hypothetical protein [Paraburkholderia nemoris]